MRKHLSHTGGYLLAATVFTLGLSQVLGGNLPLYNTDIGNQAGGTLDPNWSVTGPSTV